MVLLAATGWAFYTVLQKRLPQPAVPASAKLAVMMAAGALALAPFAAVETLTGAAPAATLAGGRAAVPAIVPSLGAYYVYGRLISQPVRPRRGCRCSGASLRGAAGWPLLGEAPQLFHAYGFVMILLGVRLASLRGRGRTATAAAPA